MLTGSSADERRALLAARRKEAGIEEPMSENEGEEEGEVIKVKQVKWREELESLKVIEPKLVDSCEVIFFSPGRARELIFFSDSGIRFKI